MLVTCYWSRFADIESRLAPTDSRRTRGIRCPGSLPRSRRADSQPPQKVRGRKGETVHTLAILDLFGIKPQVRQIAFADIAEKVPLDQVQPILEVTGVRMQRGQTGRDAASPTDRDRAAFDEVAHIVRTTAPRPPSQGARPRSTRLVRGHPQGARLSADKGDLPARNRSPRDRWAVQLPQEWALGNPAPSSIATIGLAPPEDFRECGDLSLAIADGVLAAQYGVGPVRRDRWIQPVGSILGTAHQRGRESNQMDTPVRERCGEDQRE